MEPDSRWALNTWCEVWGVVRPFDARTPDEVRVERNLEVRTEMWLWADDGGRPVGAARLIDSRWTVDSDPPEFSCAIFPSHVSDAHLILDGAVSAARSWGVSELAVECQDRRSEQRLRSEIVARGFALSDREIVSACAIDPDPYDEHRSLPDGIAIHSLADRSDLAAGAHRCFERSESDEPTSFRVARRPLEEWMREFETPWTSLDDCFVALDGSDVVGIALLERYARHPEIGWNGYTGTDPDHRGRGIARALKEHVRDHARSLGLRELRTENAEDNAAIRHINAQMGYVAAGAREWWKGPV